MSQACQSSLKLARYAFVASMFQKPGISKPPLWFPYGQSVAKPFPPSEKLNFGSQKIYGHLLPGFSPKTARLKQGQSVGPLLGHGHGKGRRAEASHLRKRVPRILVHPRYWLGVYVFSLVSEPRYFPGRLKRKLKGKLSVFFCLRPGHCLVG